MKRLRDLAKRAQNLAFDGIDFLTKKEDIPPRKLRHIIGQDRDYSGEEWFRELRERTDLKPYEKVLDVGSGTGRMSLPLIKYLDSNGTYDGLEIIKQFIDWCQKNITTKHPNFHFQHADVLNKAYNPNGKVLASDYRFPYENEAFDVVFLSSVFTHMFPRDLENYLKELVRVLKKDGRCMISYFLLSAKSPKPNFKITTEGYGVLNPQNPEEGIAYKEDYILGLYKANKLAVSSPIYYTEGGGQDVIVARKASSS